MRSHVLLAGIIACASVLSASMQTWGAQDQPSASQTLTGRDAINALIGNTIVIYSRRGFDALYFAPDGALKGASSDAGNAPAEKAKWSIEGDQLCFVGFNKSSAPDSVTCDLWGDGNRVEIEGRRARLFGREGGRHILLNWWILPGNAFNFPKGNVEATD